MMRLPYHEQYAIIGGSYVPETMSHFTVSHTIVDSTITYSIHCDTVCSDEITVVLDTDPAERLTFNFVNSMADEDFLDTTSRVGGAIMNTIYPVGAIYSSTVNSSPPFGTWQSITSPFTGAYSWERVR